MLKYKKMEHVVSADTIKICYDGDLIKVIFCLKGEDMVSIEKEFKPYDIFTLYGLDIKVPIELRSDT